MIWRWGIKTKPNKNNSHVKTILLDGREESGAGATNAGALEQAAHGRAPSKEDRPLSPQLRKRQEVTSLSLPRRFHLGMQENHLPPGKRWNYSVTFLLKREKKENQSLILCMKQFSYIYWTKSTTPPKAHTSWPAAHCLKHLEHNTAVSCEIEVSCTGRSQDLQPSTEQPLGIGTECCSFILHWIWMMDDAHH